VSTGGIELVWRHLRNFRQRPRGEYPKSLRRKLEAARHPLPRSDRWAL